MAVVVFYHRIAALLFLLIEGLGVLWLSALVVALGGWLLWGLYVLFARLRRRPLPVRAGDLPEAVPTRRRDAGPGSSARTTAAQRLSVKGSVSDFKGRTRA